MTTRRRPPKKKYTLHEWRAVEAVKQEMALIPTRYLQHDGVHRQFLRVSVVPYRGLWVDVRHYFRRPIALGLARDPTADPTRPEPTRKGVLIPDTSWDAFVEAVGKADAEIRHLRSLGFGYVVGTRSACRYCERHVIRPAGSTEPLDVCDRCGKLQARVRPKGRIGWKLAATLARNGLVVPREWVSAAKKGDEDGG